MDLVINTTPSVERYSIAVVGEVDISNASHLRDAVDYALEQPCESIALDFSGVSYIDSTGLGVLVGSAHRAAERDRGFSVEHLQPSVERIVSLLGVDAEINVIAE